MNDTSYDNFEYLYLLAKNLGNGCRSSRKETDKIDLLLRRLSKQTAVTYEELSQNPDEKTINKFEEMTKPSDVDMLIKENYRLVYEIQQQEHINDLITKLVNNINEHLTSIRNFIIEQKLARDQNNEIYLHETFTMRENLMKENIDNLDMHQQITHNNVTDIIDKFEKLFNSIEWDQVPKDNKEYQQIKKQIDYVNSTYGLNLTSLEMEETKV
ncbi:Factor arrest protein 3 [Nakaseomyces bracarensis]|uniref:Factor arrest protein 3 n=1 Tax=Nakaseomyces bracarensis TaxID=273131 RepID=A0ABR4NUN7_9SACH